MWVYIQEVDIDHQGPPHHERFHSKIHLKVIELMDEGLSFALLCLSQPWLRQIYVCSTNGSLILRVTNVNVFLTSLPWFVYVGHDKYPWCL